MGFLLTTNRSQLLQRRFSLHVIMLLGSCSLCQVAALFRLAYPEDLSPHLPTTTGSEGQHLAETQRLNVFCAESSCKSSSSSEALMDRALPVLRRALSGRGNDSAAEAREGVPSGSIVSNTSKPTSASSTNSEKGVIATCSYGQLSNQLFCMRAYLALAIALGRTLVVPTWGYLPSGPFRWSVAVDWEWMAQCLEPFHGSQTVVMLDQYQKAHTPNVTDLSGFTNLLNECDSGACRRLLRLNNLSFVYPIENRTLADIFEVWATDYYKFVSILRSVTAEDIILGDLFKISMVLKLPNALIKVSESECSNIWRSHPVIMEFSQSVQQFLGNYSAKHLRRGDYYSYMSRNGAVLGEKLALKGYKPVVQEAAEIQMEMCNRGQQNLWLATNARSLEVNIFKQVLEFNATVNSSLQVFTLSDYLQAVGELPIVARIQKLAAEVGNSGLVWSMVDKQVCVDAKVFFSSRGSTFSGDIVLRRRESSAL